MIPFLGRVLIAASSVVPEQRLVFRWSKLKESTETIHPACDNASATCESPRSSNRTAHRGNPPIHVANSFVSKL